MILHNAEVLHQGLVDAEGHDDSHDGHDHDHDH
jgi:zinc/manganese transport system substrate-binding protein